MTAQDLTRHLDSPNDHYRAATCVGVLAHLDSFLVLEVLRVVERGGLVLFSQREDLVLRHGFRDVLARLTDAGKWTPVEITAPLPYVAEHPEYKRLAITARYYAYAKS